MLEFTTGDLQVPLDSSCGDDCTAECKSSFTFQFYLVSTPIIQVLACKIGVILYFTVKTKSVLQAYRSLNGIKGKKCPNHASYDVRPISVTRLALFRR